MFHDSIVLGTLALWSHLVGFFGWNPVHFLGRYLWYHYLPEGVVVKVCHYLGLPWSGCCALLQRWPCWVGPSCGLWEVEAAATRHFDELSSNDSCQRFPSCYLKPGQVNLEVEAVIAASQPHQTWRPAALPHLLIFFSFIFYFLKEKHTGREGAYLFCISWVNERM